MKITVWHNCAVVAELNVPDAPGPDVSVDPWSDLLGVNWPNGIHQVPVGYQEHGVATQECEC